MKVDGVVIESSSDGFAQDNYGHVWYFREVVYELENSLLVSIDAISTDDLGAGIAMITMLLVGNAYCQECAISIIHGPV